MPLFPNLAAQSKPPSSYQEYWQTLPRDTSKYEYYRAHQLKMLEEYAAVPDEKRDVALCLPTGSGKTIVALSIAGFAQRQRKRMILYLCPTNQLVAQVVAEANGIGVPAVAIDGPWPEVDADSKARYESGTAIGVASYFSLFNSAPKVGKPEMVLCDDVHAAAQSILNPWKLEISKSQYPSLFKRLYDILKAQVSGPQLAVLGKNPSPERDVDLVRARDWLMVVDSFQKHISKQAKNSDLRHAWKRIENKLANCYCFLESGSITIRPWVPPTFELPEFSAAKRRIFMSATLDRWGHIEHISGITNVHRLTQPEVGVPGRRLILNLQRLMTGTPELSRITHMAMRTSKALVLCRNNRDRDDVIKALNGKKYAGRILGTGVLEADLAAFAKAPAAILVLANRYDGLDLGDGLCRNIVMWKLPLAVDTQEDFTTRQWNMTDAAESRARQRVHQGMGRCTRRDADAAIVSIVGDDLASFLLRPQVQEAMPRRIRAELSFFQQLTKPEDLEGLVEACLGRGEDWKGFVSQLESIAGSLAEEVQPDGRLMEIHRREANFMEKHWTRNYPAASEIAQRSAQDCVAAKAESAAAPWFYLASSAEDLLQYEASQSPYSPMGARLLGEATQRSGGRTWFGELSAYMSPPSITDANQQQVEGIAAFLRSYPSQTGKLDAAFKEALGDLSQTSATRYHKGLRFLGTALGFTAVSPKRQGAPDVTWALGSHAIAIFEAKTDKLPTSSLAINEIRQIVSLPSEVKANEGLTVPESLQSVCVTPCKTAAAEAKDSVERFSVCHPANVLDFAGAWFERLSSLHKRAPASQPEFRALVQAAMRQFDAGDGEIGVALGFSPASTALELVAG